MKIAVVVVLCAAVVAAVPAVFDAQLDEEWQSFKATHDKKYSANMEPMRRLIWEQNVRHIEKHNLEADMGKHTYWMGVNKFADMTNEEFRRSMMGFRVDAASMVHKDAMAWVAPSNVVLPDTVDWRKNGYVTSVKDQQQCGSCWAFTAAGALEGQHFKKTGVLVSVSAQQMMDCSDKWGNQGCNGGLMDPTFTYIKAVKGIMNDTVYPYTAQDGKCKFNRTEVAATCTGFVDLPVGDEYALQVAVATIGPISAAIDASHEGFQMYKSGVYDEPDCSSTQVDHTLVIVGYGTMNNQAYWLAKNSWGTSWGLDGYIMMSRNKSNQCGIASTVSYPTV